MNESTRLPGLDEELRFLRSPSAYGAGVARVRALQTHMSWLFFAGDCVYKLKKPVRHDFLDFSTPARREFYCREELRLNARLAPGVYLGLLALQWHGGRFTLLPAGAQGRVGDTVDWLVRMRRLDAKDMLDRRIRDGRVALADVDALLQRLVSFYRGQPAALVDPAAYHAGFLRQQAGNRAVLLGPKGGLPGSAAALDRLDAALLGLGPQLRERARASQVLEGHGDLRPEHVCLEHPPVVIDCLEFNAALRRVDPFDEIAYLALECEMAGAAWIGARLWQGCAAALPQPPPPALRWLYTAYRALLRARLVLAHLLDPAPRTPSRWAPLALRYIGRAQQALDALDALSTAPGTGPS